MLGRLRQSIQVQLTQDEHQVAAHVGSDLEKAVWLEKGTRSMAPRPFLGPAFEETRAEVEAILSQRWDE
jgi:HK97 gp10 family phage protein